MTMLDTLFGLIPAASRGQQWVAEDLQLVNWGGYDGAHRVRFSPGATLLCGGSGSGKSTLMDAYIALMMPHTTPFNGASNGGVTGRPRGEDQRNILSYARGKLDESRTDEGTAIRVLRGDGADTWTAVAMTWADHDGSRFTAIRAWYVPARARTLEETVRVRATVDGVFALAALQDSAAKRFSDAALRAEGLEPLATDREFSARLHSVLGIGAAGAGGKAMSLLARIQAGQQITTVDDLYKRLVLEEPETLSAADAVVAHFDELESTRVRMLTARQQVAALEPLRELRDRIAASAERVRLIDAVGRIDDAVSPAAAWRAQKRLGLLHGVEEELRERTRALDSLLVEKRALLDAAEAERDGLAQVLRDSGGDRLETAEREIREVERRLVGVRSSRARLDEDLRALGESETTRERFEAVLEQSGDAATARRGARAAWAEARTEQASARRALAELEEEERAVADRRDSIPRPLHEARRLVAEAAGLSVDEMLFVGELLEVRAEFEPWREAFTLALGGFATTLLIDVARLGRFRAAIDFLRPPVRLRYEGVQTGLHTLGAVDPRTLPGRLDYRPSDVTGWLQAHLVDRFGFVCVDRTEDLDRHRRAITLSGQLAQGHRGAHGGHGAADVLGFSSTRRLGELVRAVGGARARLAVADAAAEATESALDALEDRLVRLARLEGLRWDQVDVESLVEEHDRWTGVQAAVSADHPELAGLQVRLVESRRRTEGLQEDIARARVRREQVEIEWAAAADDVDASQETLDTAGRAGRELHEDQVSFLDARFALPEAALAGPATEVLRRFDAALTTATQRLEEDRGTAAESLRQQRETAGRIMAAFLERWPNPSLLADPDASMGDFEHLLVALETSGLHRLEADWRDSLVTLSGNDLTSFDSTLSRSLREIRERIEPINEILQDLPFSDDAHRLQITTRENQSDVRRRFRRDLRDVRAQIQAAGTDEEREQVYRRMSRLLQHMRRSAPDFGDLVDVRNHVRVSAERVEAVSRSHVALYDHIGEKSGGESQELIAFIVGAALRYQLGDAGADRPRYAPVFLDEALIKADAHFTKRAIGAWRGLGFQLVIGAPNDKYSAIEPHVEVEYDIVKDPRGRSWARPKVGLAEEG